ncbi:hypothetical protein CBS101457_000962 [Exobasidium rhododendri]|nr:hypothetical protein CBS101457_000962 [Exobasidium rhododendri]
MDMSRLPFHNYPRSLRELAIRAREEGTLEAKAEYRAAQEEQSKRSQAEASGLPSSEETVLPDSLSSTSSRWTRPSRPSKEDLLRFAQGFWTRLRIRFKWFTIRGFRRFNADDISAFFTLGGLGTVIFIIVGTTTAVSLVFSAFNILNMQEWIARKIADYLTHETGVTVIFESAIVPKWKDSRICFQNVFISRRAYGHDAETLRKERLALQKGERRQSKPQKRRMTAVTAGQGMAWEGTHFNEYDDAEVVPPMSDKARGELASLQSDVNGEHINSNFSMFDLSVDTIEVKLSFSRWLDGKGLVEDAVVQGVRGIVDRRNVFWDKEKPYDPREARRQGKNSGFELASLTVSDFLVTVYQPGDFRPFNFSIFEAQIPRLRRQWLFYDILCADRITGQVDGCLLSLHKPQSIGRTTGKEREIMTGRWKTLSRLRIDGINIDHIQNQSDVHGPVSWIRSGQFDLVADIKLPKEASSDIDINVIISDMLDNLSNAVSGEHLNKEHGEEMPIPGQHRLSGPAIQAPMTTVGPNAEGAWKKREADLKILRDEDESSKKKKRSWRKEMDNVANAVNANREAKNAQKALAASSHVASVVIDLDVRFKDIKAAVPLFSSDLNYRTQTFVRPIVAFMNANQTLIPVHCRVVMDLSEFDGALDLAQTGLLPVISEKIYEALAHHVSSHRATNQRIKSVSQWWLRKLSENVLQYALLIRDSSTRSRSQPPGDTSSLSLQSEIV